MILCMGSGTAYTKKLHTKHWFVLNLSMQLLFGIPIMKLRLLRWRRLQPGGPAAVIFFTFLGTVPVPVQLGKIASFPPSNWENKCCFPVELGNTMTHSYT